MTQFRRIISVFIVGGISITLVSEEDSHFGSRRRENLQSQLQFLSRVDNNEYALLHAYRDGTYCDAHCKYDYIPAVKILYVTLLSKSYDGPDNVTVKEFAVICT
jgi:hypothetical protein